MNLISKHAKFRYLGLVALLLLLGLGLISHLAASYLSKNRSSTSIKPPALEGTQALSLDSHDGRRLQAWLMPAENPRGCVLLLHGIGGSAAQMYPRAVFFRELGYTSLMYDSRGHGHSAASQISFGYAESRDAATAFDWLKRQVPNRPCLALGVSLGAAAIALGPVAEMADGLILESPYRRLEDALDNRLQLYFGKPGRLLKYLLLPQLRWQLGVDADWFDLAQALASNNVPSLILNGGRDQRAPTSQARDIYDQLGGPKAWHVFSSAAHEDFLAHQEQTYRDLLIQFLNENFPQAPPPLKAP